MNAAVPQETDAPNEIEVCQFPAPGKPLARIYAHGGDAEHYANLRIEIGDKRISMTPEQWANLGIEVETLRLQLAACGVAAMCNTADSAARQRLAPDSPYRSGSYEQVCATVDSEMRLRAQVGRLSMLERELTFDERATWGDCPACGVQHGESCHHEVGFALGVSPGGGRPTEGAHFGRLQRAPFRVKTVAA